MAGAGFERTMVSHCAMKGLLELPLSVAGMQLSVDFSCQLCHVCLQVLRLEPHCVISNCTGTPLQITHFKAATQCSG